MQVLLIIAIILFVIAAGFGAFVLLHILKNKPTPKPAVYLHGSIAAVALLILLYSVFHNPSHALVTSLILFLIAAIGGFTLFYTDITKRKIPKWLAVIHPLIAAAGLIVLIIYLVS